MSIQINLLIHEFEQVVNLQNSMLHVHKGAFPYFPNNGKHNNGIT